MKTLVTLCLPALLFVAGCRKTDANTHSGTQPDVTSGLGYSTGTPKGIPFRLPDGIVMEELKLDADGERNNRMEQKGSGVGLFRTCVTLMNTGSTPVTVTLPAGLMFVSSDLDHQNGILLTPVTVTIGVKSPARFLLNGYCLNPARKVSGYNHTYTMGPVTQNPHLKQLIGLIGNKELQVLPDGNAADRTGFLKMSRLQKLTDRITLDGQLSASEWAEVKSF